MANKIDKTLALKSGSLQLIFISFSLVCFPLFFPPFFPLFSLPPFLSHVFTLSRAIMLRAVVRAGANLRSLCARRYASALPRVSDLEMDAKNIDLDRAKDIYEVSQRHQRRRKQRGNADVGKEYEHVMALRVHVSCVCVRGTSHKSHRERTKMMHAK